MKQTKCRMCGSKNLKTFLDLGKMPLVDLFKTKKDLMDYIIYVMIRKLVEIEAKQKKLLNTNFDLYEIFKNHLYFIISYRFFFRDILEILE